MARSVDEWIGKTDDTAIPARVRLRVFERYGGKCYLSGRIIRAGEPWHLDHVVPLIGGGENRESNLAPVLTSPHREKTKKDVQEKALVAKKRMRHLGIKRAKRKMGYRTFSGKVVKPRWG